MKNNQCHSMSECLCCYGTIKAHAKVTEHCQFCEPKIDANDDLAWPRGSLIMEKQLRELPQIDNWVAEFSCTGESDALDQFTLDEQAVIWSLMRTAWNIAAGRTAAQAADTRPEPPAEEQPEKCVHCGHRFHRGECGRADGFHPSGCKCQGAPPKSIDPCPQLEDLEAAPTAESEAAPPTGCNVR